MEKLHDNVNKIMNEYKNFIITHGFKNSLVLLVTQATLLCSAAEETEIVLKEIEKTFKNFSSDEIIIEGIKTYKELHKKIATQQGLT